MQDFFEPFLGPTGALIAQFAVWTLIVLVALLVGWWLVGRIIGLGRGNFSRGRVPRLAIIDALALDQRRRLVLIRRDNLEHLILIGGAGDVVVEAGIHRQKTAAKPAEKRGGDTTHTIALPPLAPLNATVAAGTTVAPAIPVVAPPRVDPSGPEFAQPEPGQPEPARHGAVQQGTVQPGMVQSGAVQPGTVQIEPVRSPSERIAEERIAAEAVDPGYPDFAPEPAIEAAGGYAAEPGTPAEPTEPRPSRRLIMPAPVTPADFADGRPSAPEPYAEPVTPPAATTARPAESSADPQPFAPHRDAYPAEPEPTFARPPETSLPTEPTAPEPMAPEAFEHYRPQDTEPAAGAHAPSPIDREAATAGSSSGEPAVVAAPDFAAPVEPPAATPPETAPEPAQAAGPDAGDRNEDRHGDTARVEELRREMARLLGERPSGPD